MDGKIQHRSDDIRNLHERVLHQLLSANDAHARSAAIRNVYFHQADSLSITLAVANCLRDPDPQVRQLAAALLCEPRHRTPLVVRDLTSCLQDHDPDVLIFACQAILALGVRTTDACPALLQLTNDPRPDVRCAARAAAALVQG